MTTRDVIERFEIALEHDIDEQYQYEPGEYLRGNVIVQLNEPIKVKAIEVHITGESTVSWEDMEKKYPMQYKASETYINVSQDLLFADKDLITLDIGTHKFPLEYALPQNIPSSFIGKFGSITYVVKATLKEDKKFGLSTMITSEPFLVLRRLDISKEHNLQMERKEHLQKNFTGALAFCVRGKVSSMFRINKTGHLPGEDIFMDAEIENKSPRTVEAVEASIIMHSTFHAKNKKKQNRQIVNQKRDVWELIEGEGRRWKGVRLTIPPYIPESRLDGCDIIDIRYELEFKIDVSNKSSLSVTIPITIGTVNGGNKANGNSDLSKTTMTLKRQKWLSKDNMGNMTDFNANGDDFSGMGADPTDIDLHEMDDMTLNFRRPLAYGEVRKNPLLEPGLGVTPPDSPVEPYSPQEGKYRKKQAPLPPAAGEFDPPPPPPMRPY